MKKFIKILAPILMFSLFASYSFAEKYSITNPEKFQDEKQKSYHCNLNNGISGKSCYGCKDYSTRTICCYDEDGKPIWEDPQYKNENQYGKVPKISDQNMYGPVNKSENIDTDWYQSNAWGIKHKRGIEKKYVRGKSLGVCIKKDGTGFYYTAVSSFSRKKNKKQSWLNISSRIGQRAWSRSPGNIYGESNKDFPIFIGEIKKLRIIYDYIFKSKGKYNNNITLWLVKPGADKPFMEVMLKFDRTAIKHKRRRHKNLKTNNYEFIVWSNKGQEWRRKNEGLDYFFSIDAFEKNTKRNKNGEYFVDIDLKKVFDYLLEQKLLTTTDILRGFTLTTEIWDGAGEMKIKKLKYEIEKGEKIKLIGYVATAKNKKDDLFQMKSRKYYSASEAEKDVMKRCKMFFEPHGKNMQEACYINNIEKVENK